MKKLLSVLAALAAAVSLSACQTGQADTVVSETTQIEVTTQTEKDYSDYEEFPEGWSAERVLNMVSIDGHQLSFPCTVDDILTLSEDFEVKDERYKAEKQKFAHLYYKNTQIADICYYDNGCMFYTKFYDTFQNGYLYYENISFQNNDKIIDLLQPLLNDLSDPYGTTKKFTDNETAVTVRYSEIAITLLWEEVK